MLSHIRREDKVDRKELGEEKNGLMSEDDEEIELDEEGWVVGVLALTFPEVAEEEGEEEEVVEGEVVLLLLCFCV